MILTTHKPVIERSEDFQETLFSVGDYGIIFDILRSKMYSNPILSICREISSNARDAHREVKTPEVPIQITIPTTFDLFYRIKDFGPGISPERVADIYTKWGASTKRQDNTQGGGFGCGSRTPFSYTSSFNVQTIVDGTQYNYCCYIDESNIGKVALLDKFSTDAANGTTVIIPVKEADFRAFREGTEFVCRHWTTRPTITNEDNFPFQTIAPALTGSNWAVDSQNYYHQDVKLIIDGIEYPLNYQDLKDKEVDAFCQSIYGVIYLTFGIGDLSLSANREQVHLDKRTQASIIDRLKQVGQEIKAAAQSKIEACENFYQANFISHSVLPSIFHSPKTIEELTWKGHKLLGSNPTVEDKLATITSFLISHYAKTNITSYNIYQTLYFDEGHKLVLNDTDLKPMEIEVKHIRALAKDDKDLRYVHIITPAAKKLSKLNQTYHFDEMALTKLSDVPVIEATEDAPITKTKSGVIRFDLFKLDDGSFRRSSLDILEKDAQTVKVFCSLKRPAYRQDSYYFRHPLCNSIAIENYMMTSLAKLMPDVSFYGAYSDVPEAKVKEHCGDLMTLDKYLDDALSKVDGIDILQVLNANRTIHYDTDHLDTLPMEKITNQQSPLIKLLKLKKQQIQLSEEWKPLVQLYETMNGAITETKLAKWRKKNPDQDYNELESEVYKRYPMLKLLDGYAIEDNVALVVDYVNTTDKSKGKK